MRKNASYSDITPVIAPETSNKSRNNFKIERKENTYDV
jgi:hypothetical protein